MKPRIMLPVLFAVSLMASAKSANSATPPQGPAAGAAQSSGDAGAVRVPPQTDPAGVATPPKNVDPGIDNATDSIDAKNQKKSTEKKTQKRKHKHKQGQASP